ncbi:MAG TPA: DUF3108 domain-containing protein [Bacteroidales bacterium]|nr:DUF3108 domain-containing protein [Bacteroidales bacterium]
MNTRSFFSKALLCSFLIAHCALYAVSPAIGQELKRVDNRAFIPGEKFNFIVYYDSYLTGKVTAGTASLEIGFQKKEIEGRKVYHAMGKGKSKGAFNVFFKVDDYFESFIDMEYMVPWYFIRRTREGDYKKDDEVRFNQFTGSASSRTISRSVPKGTQDFISAFFYARTIDLSGLKPGDFFPMSYFLDDSIYITRIYYEGKETIKTVAGTFRCMKFKPTVATGNVFSQPYAMSIWVTDDQYRIPVLAKSEVIVGAVKMELTQYQGLSGIPPALMP